MPESDAHAGNKPRTKPQQESRQRMPSTDQGQLTSELAADMQEPQHPGESLVGSDFSQDTFERHAALLGDSQLSRTANARPRIQILRQLQRDYGNQYVQRLGDHISRQRAGTQNQELDGSNVKDREVGTGEVISLSLSRGNNGEKTPLQAEHTVQRGTSVERIISSGGFSIQRAVSAEYNTIKDNLSYGLFDWAITDSEAREVLQILEGLSDDDFQSTVQQMRRDEILDRLLDNISSEDQRSFGGLLDDIRTMDSEISGLPDCCKQALGTIDRIISSATALRGLLGAAPFISLIGNNPPEVASQLLTSNWDLYLEAVGAVDPIMRNRVKTVIELHLLDHQGDTELEFWQNMHRLWSGG